MEFKKEQTLSVDFFRHNRRFCRNNMQSSSLSLLFSADIAVSSNDNLYPWKQDANFYYLTGLNSPNCILLLSSNDNGVSEEILFIPTIDPEIEKWERAMLTKEKAKEISGIEEIYFVDEFDKLFFRAQKWQEILYLDYNDVFPQQPLNKVHTFAFETQRKLPSLQIKKFLSLVVKSRMKKTDAEVQLIKKAIDITALGLKNVARTVKYGIKEYEVVAELMYQYYKNGAGVAFNTIAASGKNATILHYMSNDDTLDKNAILIDTGASYGMYNSDITRVYPINGKFSGKLQHCYETVLEIQIKIINNMKSGYSYSELYEVADTIQYEILQREKFLSPQEIKHKHLTYHRVGHSIGLDVHDPSKLDTPLEENTVITVEPGLYLPNEAIGIRIEDDILLKKDKSVNLSALIPKNTADIEKIMNDDC